MSRLSALLLFLVLSALSGAHDLGICGVKLIQRSDSAVITTLGRAPLETLIIEANGKRISVNDIHVIIDKSSGKKLGQIEIHEPVTLFTVKEAGKESSAETVVTVMKDGRVIGEGLVDKNSDSWSFGKLTPTPLSKTAIRFLWMGVMHILSGPDHLLFILGLLLARPKLAEILKIATSFTVAHAITLCLCAFGIVAGNPRIVEPLIALSIVAVAAESYWHQAGKRDYRILIAFAFGLIHGFGFAGAIVETGLPATGAGLAVASFNIGIELVQIALICLALPLLGVVAKLQIKVIKFAPIVVGLVGLFWFVQRVI